MSQIDPQFSLEPLNDFEIASLKNTVRKKFGFDLPAQYVDLLRITNGFEYDGERICGMDNEILTEKQGQEFGLIELNEAKYSVNPNRRFFFLGDGNMDNYVLHLESGLFYQMDAVSYDIIEEFKSFNDMILFLLEDLLNRAKR